MICREARARIHPYVDGELGTEDQLALEGHLLACRTCRAEYDSVRQVVDTLRGSKPLYPEPPSLRLKVRTILELDRSKHSRRTRLRAALMSAAFAATLVVALFLPTLRGQRFTSFAAGTHLRYAQGLMPLGVVSEEPEAVSRWLHSHLPFHLALPDYPAEFGKRKSYSLVGARLLKFEGNEVAYLAYTMEKRPISLLVTQNASVIPSRGEIYQSGKLTFHLSSERGLKLISWRDRGLSYALVSDVQVNGAQSCIVCHGSAAEREKFQNLFRQIPPQD